MSDFHFDQQADKYFCEVCDGGDDEEHMLLCDGCDDAYHMQCLTPALTDVPPGDWICPKCLAKVSYISGDVISITTFGLRFGL